MSGSGLLNSYKDLHSDRTGFINSSPYSLFGDFEPFSAVVRKIVPRESGEPVDLAISENRSRGWVTFNYWHDGDFIWLSFSYINGECLVTVANGTNEFIWFNSIQELKGGFSSWYNGLWGKL